MKLSKLWTGLMLVSIVVSACAVPPAPGAAPSVTQPPAPSAATEAPSAPTEAPSAATEAPQPVEAAAETLNFSWFTDGPDQAAIEKLIKEFESQNPDIKVALSIVPFADLNQLLTTQAEAGQAPDLARVTDPARFAKHLLDIKSHLKDQTLPSAFVDQAMALTTGPNGEVYGYPHDFTLNGPFINMALVKKAGLDLPTGDKLSWKDWIDLAVKVQKATGVPYAAAVDRSGHRLDGFIQTMGGGYFTPDGKGVRVNSPDNLAAINYFVQLNKDGVMPLEVWAGGGQGYADAKQLFANQQLVFYVSGNWQMAFFDKTIGDKFEWKVVPNACEAQCGGMPGGKFLIAFNNTKTNPARAEKVARLLEYLGSKEAVAQYVSDSLFLPARKDLIAEGVQYPSRNDDMNVFIKGIAALPDSSYVDNYNPKFGPVATEVRDRVTQAIVGELSVEDALQAAQTKAEELIK